MQKNLLLISIFLSAIILIILAVVLFRKHKEKYTSLLEQSCKGDQNDDIGYRKCLKERMGTQMSEKEKQFLFNCEILNQFPYDCRELLKNNPESEQGTKVNPFISCLQETKNLPECYLEHFYYPSRQLKRKDFCFQYCDTNRENDCVNNCVQTGNLIEKDLKIVRDCRMKNTNDTSILECVARS